MMSHQQRTGGEAKRKEQENSFVFSQLCSSSWLSGDRQAAIEKVRLKASRTEIKIEIKNFSRPFDVCFLRER